MAHLEIESQCPYEAALVQVNAKIDEHTARFTVLNDSLLDLSRKPRSREGNHSALALHTEMHLAMEHIQAANAVKIRIMAAKVIEKQMKEHLRLEIIKAGPGAVILPHMSTRESVLTTLAGELGRARAERVLRRVEQWMHQQGRRLGYPA